MRVLFVSETYPPEINGVAMTTGRMVNGLRARGHWVGLVRPRQHRNDAGEKVTNGMEWTVPGIPLPNYAGLRMGLPVWRRLAAIMREQRPQVVHVVTEGPLGWAALYAARSLNIPVSSGYHTHFDQYSQHYGARWLSPLVTHWLDALHRRCQATLVPAPELAESLSQRGIPNVQVIGRGVDTALFNPSRRDERLRQAWQAEHDEAPVCLYVGRLAPEKNLDLVVRAHGEIAARNPAARMVWVGDGPSLARLRREYPQHVFAGPRRGADLAAHYASADVFLFASLSETWGNVIGEAMACGLGVVAYRRAAASALIRPGENGLAPAPGDAAEFMAASLQLSQDRVLRRRLAAQAHADMQAQGWDTVLARLEAVLATLARAA